MTQPRNTIRTFALVCVAVTSAYVMFMGWTVIQTLSSPQWCARAMGAGSIVGKDKTVAGLEGCVDLLKIQLEALSWASVILLAVIALCLLSLMLIVVAGGKISFKASKTGLEGDIARDDDPAPAAAQVVADAAQDKADEIKEEVKP